MTQESKFKIELSGSVVVNSYDKVTVLTPSLSYGISSHYYCADIGETVRKELDSILTPDDMRVDFGKWVLEEICQENLARGDVLQTEIVVIYRFGRFTPLLAFQLATLFRVVATEVHVEPPPEKLEQFFGYNWRRRFVDGNIDLISAMVCYSSIMKYRQSDVIYFPLEV